MGISEVVHECLEQDEGRVEMDVDGLQNMHERKAYM